jgi:hypothetical protein
LFRVVTVLEQIIKNLLHQNPDYPALALNTEGEVLVNTLTGSEYEYRVFDILKRPSEFSGAERATQEAAILAQYTAIKTFLGEEYAFLAIIDTSNKFDELLNASDDTAINQLYTAASRVDPAFHLNYESNNGENYKAKYYKETPPTGTDETKYISVGVTLPESA